MKKNKAFSLAEILISVLIITTALLLALPVITKKTTPLGQKFRGGSQVFLFNQQNQSDYPCYVTKIESGKTSFEESPGNCQTYEFTVPSKVHKIDLTLVAGGGGGGGAAGGTLYSESFYSGAAEKNVPLDIFKGLKVILLTGAGENGGSANLTASPYKGGKGGHSGHGIYNYTMLKDFILNKISYTLNSFEQGNITLSYGNGFTKPSNAAGTPLENFGGAGLLMGANNIKYALYAQDYGHTNGVACYTVDNTAGVPTFSNKGEGHSACSVAGNSYLGSRAGQNGFSVASTTPLNNFTAYTMQGGLGGSLTGLESIKGAGGRGESVIFLCNGTSASCNASNAKQEIVAKETINTDFSAKNRYGETLAIVEHPGGVGGGGAGGVALKINGFPVEPGAKYTVVVGSGGAGGIKGAQGITLNGAKHFEASNGTKGLSGAASAIYDENGRLIMLVAGGLGGNGGTINSAGSLARSNPALPESARYAPVVLYKNSINASLVDTDITGEIADLQSGQTVDLPTGLSAKYVKYAFVENKIAPYYELTTNNQEIMFGGQKASLAYDNLVGGFTKFNNIATSPGEVSATTANNFGGANNQNVYSGFYYKHLLGGDFVYAGGPGGFSGLGTKAGCGGFFVANADGLKSNSGTYSSSSTLKNTFATSSVDIAGRIFSVDEYFSNCTISTPDGQMAEFIPPKYSVGSGLKLGQAGAGGGGGGWSPTLGAGNGGRGQNGYVFIQWQTD